MRKRNGQPLPLGVTVTESGVNFSVAVSHGKNCQLMVREKGEKTPYMIFDMPRKEGIGEVRFLTLENFDFDKYEYDYIIDEEISVDPYVKELTGNYDWEGDKPLKIPFHDVIAYSLHVKGFTNHESSNVLKKGTFDGIIEKLPYLRELGVNQIQLMPVYESKSDNPNYWGYGPGYYMLPKSEYSSGGSASVALKNLVKACHKQGIEVVLEIAFDKEVKRYMIHDCLRQYVIDYHVDGFLLDFDIVPMDDVYDDPILKESKFFRCQQYFQNDMRRFLKSDEGMIQTLLFWQNFKEDRSVCNYITSHNGFTLKDLVSYQDKHNELNGEDNQDGPNDNYSWNCGAEGPTQYEEINSLRSKQMKNAMTLLLLAQGIPCILSGDEFGNTQYGNNNAYCQDNEISWLDWNDKIQNQELYSFVQQLIRFRKDHAVFRQQETLTGKMDELSELPDVSYHGAFSWQPALSSESREVGICYAGNRVGDCDIYVAYNMHWEDKPFALPKLSARKNWQLVMTTEEGFLTDPFLLPCQKKVTVPGRTIAVFVGK